MNYLKRSRKGPLYHQLTTPSSFLKLTFVIICIKLSEMLQNQQLLVKPAPCKQIIYTSPAESCYWWSSDILIICNLVLISAWMACFNAVDVLETDSIKSVIICIRLSFVIVLHVLLTTEANGTVWMVYGKVVSAVTRIIILTFISLFL